MKTRPPNAIDVLAKFGDRWICDRCRATVSNYRDKCSAPLSEPCQGFIAYDAMLLELGPQPVAQAAK